MSKLNFYSVYLLHESGTGCYLSYKGRSTWRTMRAAKKHLNDCRALIEKGRFFAGIVDCWIERD